MLQPFITGQCFHLFGITVPARIGATARRMGSFGLPYEWCYFCYAKLMMRNKPNRSRNGAIISGMITIFWVIVFDAWKGPTTGEALVSGFALLFAFLSGLVCFVYFVVWVVKMWTSSGFDDTSGL